MPLFACFSSVAPQKAFCIEKSFNMASKRPRTSDLARECQVSQYAFRHNFVGFDIDDLKETLREIASKWVFQVEKGDDGYLHYQGQFALKKKRRVSELKSFWTTSYGTGALKFPLPMYCAPVAKPNTGDVFYETKLDTRVEGPYTDKDEVKVLTRQLKSFVDKELYPWQAKVLNMVKEIDDRNINIIFDQEGNMGKSIFCEWLEYKNLAFEVPPFRMMEDIMGFVMNFKVYPAYLIDMPRGMKKDKLGEFYSGIESLKNGVAYDKRYEGKKIRFDRPQIVVFTNCLPDFGLLSRDRWRVWQTTADKDIVFRGIDEYMSIDEEDES